MFVAILIYKKNQCYGLQFFQMTKHQLYELFFYLWKTIREKLIHLYPFTVLKNYNHFKLYQNFTELLCKRRNGKSEIHFHLSPLF